MIRKANILTFIIASIIITANAQTESKVVTYNNVIFQCFVIKVDTHSVKNFSFIENSSLLPHDSLRKTLDTTKTYITTASIVDSLCQPLGFYCNNGTVLQKTNTQNGKGNFYLKPNGALLITTTTAIICEASQISNYTDILQGIQSGTMLVLNKNINANFNPVSTNKNIRSGVGLFTDTKGDSYLVFGISTTPVTFYHFANFFISEFNCSNALSLENGNSVMSIPFLENKTDKSRDRVCRYIEFKD